MPQLRVLLVLLAAATFARAEPVRLPNGTALGEVNFERHVDSLLGRLGCSAGVCHGSFQGKGGLRLSLFGYAPHDDYLALTRDGLGRRVNPVDPDGSLLLLKPAGLVAHGGGKRFDRDSWEYRLLRAWIAQGARWDSRPSEVRRLDVTPREHRLAGPGDRVRLAVTAEFADGSRADVTPFCDFRVKDDSVAEVSPSGEVRAVRPGDTAVVIAYRGTLTTARALVPVPVPAGFTYPALPEENYVDREVFAKLRRLNMVPARPAGDAEFLRRLTIDTIGRLPSPDEVRAFLADPAPDRRTRKIEELLAHPLHAALWATRLCDITGNNLDTMEDPPELRPKRAKMWHDWFRRRIARNVPYDQLVHGVLCATSRGGEDVDRWMEDEMALDRAARRGFETDYALRPGLDLFWRRTGNDDFFPLEQMAERTATAFLGVRIECAQCHKHPFDRWTQADYRAYANVFAQVKFDSSPEVRAAVADLLAERRRSGPNGRPPVPRLREVYVSNHPLRRLYDPETDRALPPKALGGPRLDYDGDAREELFRWLVRPDNPYFARSFVNRVWAVYFGVGLVEPVDNLSVANPPSNERLLDALARDFTSHGYDLRRLERILLRSRAYQLSSTPASADYRDRTNFSHSYPRRLLAEVVVDVLDSALGVTEDFGPDVPRGSWAVEVAPNRVRSPELTTVFRIFGRPARASTCDCERPAEPAVPQTLFLMTDPRLLKKITAGRLKRLLDEKRSDEDVMDELFLATLSRYPSEDERRAVREQLRERRNRETGFVDVVWALINTREFILNH